MAALTAASWAVTVRRRNKFLGEKVQINELTLTVGNGVDTYPAGGIPFPTGQALGFRRGAINNVQLTDPANANGYFLKYDEANNKLRIYQGDNTNAAAAPGVELGAVAVPAMTMRARVEGF